MAPPSQVHSPTCSPSSEGVRFSGESGRPSSLLDESHRRDYLVNRGSLWRRRFPLAIAAAPDGGGRRRLRGAPLFSQSVIAFIAFPRVARTAACLIDRGFTSLGMSSGIMSDSSA